MMTSEILLSLIMFSFVSTITPGPNNLMLMTSGTNFGFKKTIPHMLGITLGFSFMLIVVGLGISSIFQKWPEAYSVLKVLSFIYMIWLAWKIAHSSAPEVNSDKVRPMTFIQAALFQWVNPKGWSMAISAVTIFSPKNDLYSVLVISSVFAVINIPSVCSWTFLGQKMRQWLSSSKRLKIFNWSMAVLLLGSMISMI